MILHDVSLPGKEGRWHIHIKKGRIHSISDNSITLNDSNSELIIQAGGAIALPGFINSHDHLDFNLFPQLGNHIYSNYKDWGTDIHKTNGESIKSVLKIQQPLRIKWGLYKNVLNGFTTVVNHGERLKMEGELITVFQDYYPIHSTAFEKNWKWKLNHPFKNRKPFVLHLGEGTDAAAISEIDEVSRMNIFKRKIVAVHGVAMDEQQASSFAGLVWCPASNYFLLNKTAAADKLKRKIKIVFGTDSTLTASWNVWEHFRQATNSNMISDDELLAMLTTIPAGLWNMTDIGTIQPNNRADIILVKKTDQLFNLNPEDILLVLQNGNIRVIDERLESTLKENLFDSFTKISLQDSIKRVQGNLAGLVQEIKKIFPAAYIPFTILNAW